MPPSDRDVIPFPTRNKKEKTISATTLVVLVAVTVLHDSDMAAEDKLTDLIETSGEAEILDSAEAIDLLCGADIASDLDSSPKAANDNLG